MISLRKKNILLPRSIGFLNTTQSDMPLKNLLKKLGAAKPRSIQALPKVAVLLCTYNGEDYLKEQLDSIVAQSYKNTEIWMSDDGSQDATTNLLKTYRFSNTVSRLVERKTTNRGFVSNFLSLVCNRDIQADYYAYADQDDIWDKDKIQRAMSWLLNVSPEIPALYCSRTQLVDANNHEIGFSPLFNKAPSFANALVQNIGGGNTMVFNNAARKLLLAAGKDVEVISHDWWTYLVVTGCGGRVFYDPYPTVRYRQHDHNMIGMNAGWCARCKRIYMLCKGRFRDWNNIHIQSLQKLRTQLTAPNLAILDQFVEARNSGFFSRLLGLKRAGVYRQTLLGNLGLFVAAILKKI